MESENKAQGKKWRNMNYNELLIGVRVGEEGEDEESREDRVALARKQLWWVKESVTFVSTVLGNILSSIMFNDDVVRAFS